MKRLGWVACAILSTKFVQASPTPDLPGIDIGEMGTAWGDTVVRYGVKAKPDSGTSSVGSWQAPSTAVQLDADEVLLGIGEGAIFVPAMTVGRLEPKVDVFDTSGRLIATGKPGRRLRVPPGRYRVKLGSGSDKQRFESTVSVKDGGTRVVEPTWSALTVTTITPDRSHVRGEYQLVRQDDFEAYGGGFGQTEDRLSELPTWILPPGIYKVSGTSSGDDDLTGFVTVRLLPGEWIDLTLVMLDTKVVGGGMLSLMPPVDRREDWRFGTDIGGSVVWTREKLSRQANLRTTTNLTGFGQLRVRKEAGPWISSARIQFVGGASQIAHDDVRITPDELTATLFTVRRITPRLGPYGRVTATSHAFPTNIDLTTDDAPLVLYVRNRQTGILELRSRTATSWEAAGSLAPLELREGAGLNVEAVQTPMVEVSLQTGIGSRQFLPSEAFFQKSIENPALLSELQALDSNVTPSNAVVMQRAVFVQGTGLEATGEMRVRLGSWASVTASPSLFWGLWPREELEFSLASVFSIHLSRFLSADYRYTVKRSLEEGALHRYPYIHQVLLRLSFGS
ncbi:MAG: putative signal peptide protein [Fibrobacterota bacterium]